MQQDFSNLPLDARFKKLANRIKVDFANPRKVRQQITEINHVQALLRQLKTELDEIIKSTYKKSGYPILSVGATLLFVGLLQVIKPGEGIVEGIQAVGEGFEYPKLEQKRKEDLRQLCQNLKVRIDNLIIISDKLTLLAEKSLRSPSLMKQLARQQIINRIINGIREFIFSFFALIFALCLSFSIYFLFVKNIVLFLLVIVVLIIIVRMQPLIKNIFYQLTKNEIQEIETEIRNFC